MVADDLVVEFPLTDCGSVKLAPAVTRITKAAFDLLKDLSRPVVVEPVGAGQLFSDAAKKLLHLGQRSRPVHRIGQFPGKQVLDWQVDLAVLTPDVDDCSEGLA